MYFIYGENEFSYLKLIYYIILSSLVFGAYLNFYIFSNTCMKFEKTRDTCVRSQRKYISIF